MTSFSRGEEEEIVAEIDILAKKDPDPVLTFPELYNQQLSKYRFLLNTYLLKSSCQNRSKHLEGSYVSIGIRVPLNCHDGISTTHDLSFVVSLVV